MDHCCVLNREGVTLFVAEAELVCVIPDFTLLSWCGIWDKRTTLQPMNHSGCNFQCLFLILYYACGVKSRVNRGYSKRFISCFAPHFIHLPVAFWHVTTTGFSPNNWLARPVITLYSFDTPEHHHYSLALWNSYCPALCIFSRQHQWLVRWSLTMMKIIPWASIKLYHTDSLHIKISTEMRICWNNKCTLQWVSQEHWW